eukprot:TRINITY_DN6655_c0_g1_i1.p1 TRINITY_DN6655_c0_g1~~TRINITY_DN6655_c0_g1_i1.p1  ORF type:complete len:644 (-),score=198.67 TRINITY_DN6655_c0_g1_i1:308-2239(-)
MEDEEEDENYSYDAPDGGWGWVVVLGSFLVNCIADGVTFSFGILFIELQEEFGLSKALTAWVVSIFHSVPLLSGPLASSFCDRYGCRLATVIGSLLATLGFLLSSLANSLSVLYITFGLIAGFGLSLCYVAAIVIVTLYFDDKRGLATGISVCGSGAGTFIFAPITHFLVTEYRWRGASILLGGCCLQMMVCGLLFKDLQWSSSPKKKKCQGSLPGRRRTKSTQETRRVSPPKMTTASLLDLPTFISPEELKSSEEILTALRNKNYKFVYQIMKSYQTAHPEEEPVLNPCSRKIIKRKMSSFFRKNSTLTGLAPPLPPEKRRFLEATIDICPVDEKHVYRMKMSKCQASHTVVRYRVRASSCPNILSSMQSQSQLSLPEQASNEPHLPPPNETICLSNESGVFSLFRNCSFMNFQFLLFCLSNLILYMWFDVMYIYLMDYAEKDLGISPKRATLLISVIGIFNMMGEIIVGWCSDKAWLNINWFYSGCMCICGLSNAFVPFLSQYWELAIMAGLYGFAIAANYSLTSPLLVEIVSLHQFSSAYGYVLLAQGMSNLIGPPLAGYLYDETEEWFYTFGLAGFFIALSGIILLVIPLLSCLRRYQSQTLCDNGSEVNIGDSEEEEPLNTVVTYHSETPEKNNRNLV